MAFPRMFFNFKMAKTHYLSALFFILPIIRRQQSTLHKIFPEDYSCEAPMSYNRILCKDIFETICLFPTLKAPKLALKICTLNNIILNILTSLCWAVKLLNVYFWKLWHPFNPGTELLTGKTAK